ncbi:hypothetical protein MLE19_21325 [Halomonas neptunia]|uniref:Uncharacterized protein n=1 Tax=Vreelandella neptunia TaxID=115551 RepID=A0ABS9SCP4_9GAMM|nr:hypothetical protein [Halomonas neptunia]
MARRGAEHPDCPGGDGSGDGPRDDAARGSRRFDPDGCRARVGARQESSAAAAGRRAETG